MSKITRDVIFSPNEILYRGKYDDENKRNILYFVCFAAMGTCQFNVALPFLVRLLIDGIEFTRIVEVQDVESLTRIPTIVNPVVPVLRCWLTTVGNNMYGERRIHLVVYNCCATAVNGTGMD